MSQAEVPGQDDASYVAVTAGAVLLAEIVIIVLASLHTTTTLTAQDLADHAQATATGLAAKLVAQIGKAGRIPVGGLGKGVPTPGVAQLDSGGGIAIPETTTGVCDPEPSSFAIVVSVSGTVLATSYPACFPAGSRAGASTVDAGAPAKLMQTQPQGSGVTPFPHGRVVWATAPVVLGGAAAPASRAPSRPPRGAPRAGRSSGETSTGRSTWRPLRWLPAPEVSPRRRLLSRRARRCWPSSSRSAWPSGCSAPGG